MTNTFTANTKEKNMENVTNTLNECLASYSVAREHLCVRAISIDRYEHLCDIQNGPIVKDEETFYLAIYLCLDDNNNGMASCPVTPAIKAMWGVHEKVLWADAIINSEKLFPAEISTLEEKLGFGRPENPQIYVVTNNRMCNGASALFYPETMHRLYEIIGEEFYVIPSSIHEVLITPVSLHKNPKDLAEMVRQINSAIVSEEDYLSDNVFKYNYSKNDILAVA